MLNYPFKNRPLNFSKDVTTTGEMRQKTQHSLRNFNLFANLNATSLERLM